MQAFLNTYGFIHIPFCECCREHTPFTPIGVSRPMAALTLDNPNSPVDPTLIMSGTESKMICMRCGNEMYRFSDQAKVSHHHASKFLKGLFSRAELQAEQGTMLGGAFLIFIFAAFLMWSGYLMAGDSLFFSLLCWLGGLFLVLVSIGCFLSSTAEIPQLPSCTFKDPNGRLFTFDPNKN